MKCIVFRLCMASIFLAAETAGMSLFNHHSEGNMTCRSDEFTCNNGNCTSMRWTCNGRDDCGDFSDEIDCQNRRPKCSSSEILCEDGRQCISESMKCDLMKDCFDASDELNCHPKKVMTMTVRPKICAEGEIRCRVANFSRCISQRLLCNGVRNCLNGEDELAVNCPNKTCRPDQLTCNNSKCVHQNRTCDGDDDCGDKSDEINCNKYVRKGEPGDVLALGSGDGLHEIDLRDKTMVTPIKSKEIVSLDFGRDPFQVYWSDRRSLNLLSLHNGASNKLQFRRGEIMSVESLAVDRLANKLYWADAGKNAIYVADLKNGKNVRLIENLNSPKAIVLSQGYMYWIDCCKLGSAYIERARLDGTQRKTLIRGGIQFPTGLAVDESAENLYWAGINADENGIIEAISLNGLLRTVKLQEKFYKPFSLDISGDYVYWSDERKNEVLRINKSNGYGEEVIMRGLVKPQGLKIQKRYVIPGTRSCDHTNGGCEDLCFNLQHPRQQRCLCREGFRLTKDGKTCEEVQEPGKANSTVKPDSNEPWIPLVILFALISLLLAFLLGVLVVKKQLLHVCSRRRAGQETREVDEDQTDREGVDPATSNTYFHDAGTQVNNANDASSELIQQSPSVTPSRSCADSEDVPLMVQVQRDAVFCNTMHVNMVNMTNNVDLQETGVTVVGDGANVTYHQPPQSSTTASL